MEFYSKPMMLKDYIWHDTSSSDGFDDYPRRLPETGTVRSLLELDHGSHGRPKLIRSTSSKAAAAAISKLQRASAFLLNTIKFVHGDNRYHKPSFLPRSLSRRLSKSTRTRKHDVDQKISSQTSMTVKDIIRWNSFTDAPNKLSLSSKMYSDRSSSTIWSSYTWSDSDFTVELGSTCSGESLAEEVDGSCRKEEENGTVGEEKESVTSPAMTYYRKFKEEGDEKEGTDHSSSYEEKEQLSPVSVLDFPDLEDSNSPSSSSSSSSDDFRRLANVERAKDKFMQNIRRFENLAQLEPINLECRIAEPELDSPTNSTGCMSISNGDEKCNTYQLGDEDHIYGVDQLLMMSHIFYEEDINVELLTEVDRKLVLDFLHEGLQGAAGNMSVDELAMEAVKWVARGSDAGVADGNNSWAVEMWELQVQKDVEGGGRRWQIFEEERDEVAVEMAVAMVEELVIEIFC